MAKRYVVTQFSWMGFHLYEPILETDELEGALAAAEKWAARGQHWRERHDYAVVDRETGELRVFIEIGVDHRVWFLSVEPVFAVRPAKEAKVVSRHAEQGNPPAR